MLVNALSISFYSVMTFVSHKECNTPAGGSVTPLITATFLIGFVIHLINFVVNTYVEPIYRVRIFKLSEKHGQNTEASGLFWNIFIVDHAFRGLIVLFSFY